MATRPPFDDATYNQIRMSHVVPKKRVQSKIIGGKRMERNVSETEGGGENLLQNVRVLVPLRVIPARNCYGVTGDLSRGNEVLNSFPDRSR